MPSTPINPRQTFLGQHMLSEASRIDEILSLDFLVKKFAAQGKESEANALFTPERFFYGFQPEDFPDDAAALGDFQEPIHLYKPVTVRPVEQDDRRRWQGGLSEVIADPDCRQQGILLVSSSGSGKTVAGQHALCDCFQAKPPEEPTLAGYIGCKLQPKGDVPKNQVLLRYLRETTHGRNASLAVVQRWLDASPPLLIFVDLNAVAPSHRDQLVIELAKFQEEQAKWGDEGHRCVTTFRSTELKGGYYNELTGNQAFLACDLTPLSIDFAQDYLEAIRKVEFLAARGWGLPLTQRNVADDISKLRELATQIRSDEHSIISTPLLMHFCTLIEGDQLDQVNNVTDLYDRVVEALLNYNSDAPAYRKRFTNQLGSLADSGSRNTIVHTVMTRAALAMLSKDANNTRLPLQDYINLVKYPVDFANDAMCPDKNIPAEQAAFTPSECSYHTNPTDWFAEGKPTPSQTDIITEFSLLRREGNDVAFLHDSLAYYFASNALQWPLGRDRRKATAPSEAWYDGTASRLSREPRRWYQPLKFLANRLENSENRLGLVERLVPADPKPGLTELVQILCRVQVVETPTEADKLLNAINTATIRYGSWCRDNSARLYPQVSHELRWHWGADHEYLKEFAHTRLNTQRDNLEPMHCTLGGWIADSNASLKLPRSISCCRILNDELIIIGCADGFVRSWNPSTGEERELVKHEYPVTALAVLGGVRVVSASDDGAVKVWSPEQLAEEAIGPEQVPTIVKHERGITALTVLAGGRVVSASRDGAVKVWSPEQLAEKGIGPEQVPTIVNHEHEVIALAVLEGGRVVSASWDGAVKVWSPEQLAEEGIGPEQVPTIVNHEHEVTALAVLEGGRVVSASRDGAVKVWSPDELSAAGIGPEQVPSVVKHEHWITALVVLEGGRVVSASLGGAVKVWSPEQLAEEAIGPEQVPTVVKHAGRVTALAVLEGGRVVSASHDGAVKVWPPEQLAEEAIGPEQVPTIVKHEHWITALTVLEGRRVVSASRDGAVKVWSPEQLAEEGIGPEQVPTIVKHARGVRALAVLERGRVVSASYDGAVKVWSPEQLAEEAIGPEQVPTIVKHDHWIHWITALTVLEGGRVVSASDDGAVKVWSPEQLAEEGIGPEQVPTVVKHALGVRALAVLEGGRVVSASHDGAVKVWSPEQLAEEAIGPKQVPTIVMHERGITALTVLEGRRVVSASEDGAVKVWSPDELSAAGIGVPSVVKDERWITALTVLEGRRVVSASEDGAVKVWSPDELSAAGIGPEQVPSVVKHEHWITALVVLEGGRVVSASLGGAVKVWSPEQLAEEGIGPEQVPTIVNHEHEVTALAVLEGGGGRVVSIGQDNRLSLVDCSSRRVLYEHAFPTTPTCVALDQTKVNLWIGFADGHVECWQVNM
ncbi:hypothetical protein [Adhaeretor mobilis]|uniref:WD domain, G-beta repeat n=1 Tax=Adhaeretor mobilis TaxID=1930276 RepID=A0A517MQQ0_9BACT|nr:hypothetical protein [Adhaeretor mobilis]QDS97209.1 WD domain, G-beta repeat [Adhaeretor mobilis]